MSYSTGEIWLIIACLGVGTFLIRFSFLGLIGGRTLPDWVLRHLRYTPVAILPGLVAPLVVWPDPAMGDPDPLRWIVVAITLGMGWWKKSLLWGGLSGVAALLLQQVF